MVVTVRGLGVLTTGDAGVAYVWYGSASERMMKSGSGVMIAVPRVAGPPVTWVFSLYVVQAGSACRGVAGRPAPTAFNRAGEKLQATGGELPRVSYGVVPDAGTGSLSPSSGRKVFRAPMLDRGGIAGQAASAGRGACWRAVSPAATAASQLVPWTIME